MNIDKSWIKRDGDTQAQTERPSPRQSAQNTAAKQTNLFASSAMKRQAVQDAIWNRLGTFAVDEAHLETHRVVTATRRDPSHTAFDVLRTKLLQTLRENAWKRVAITSPTEGCGKTFMAANLIVSLSRQLNTRSVLLDFDMRRPAVASVMGIPNPGSMADFLRGDVSSHEQFRRPGQNMLKIGDNVAIASSGVREDFASELMQLPSTSDIIDQMERDLAPDVVLFDMPPALVNDDVLAARNLYDGVLMVVGGGISRAQDVREVERRLGTETPLLGIVLNRSEGISAKVYSY